MLAPGAVRLLGVEGVAAREHADPLAHVVADALSDVGDA